MKLKQFLKPDWRKITLVLIIFIFLPIIPLKTRIVCAAFYEQCPPFVIQYISLVGLVFRYLENVFYIELEWLRFSLLTFVSIILSYFFSCLIAYKIDRLTSEKRKMFKDFFKVTIAKIILSIFGWVTLIGVYVHYLVGVYGGMSNFSPELNSFYSFGEFVSIIPIPFTIFTLWVLLPITTIVGVSFMAITGIPIEISWSNPMQPEYLSTFGAIYVFIALIIEWYCISCLIVWVYDKMKKK